MIGPTFPRFRFAAAGGAAAPRRLRRLAPWAALVALLLVAQTLLVALTRNYESVRAQEDVDRAATDAASDIARTVARNVQSLQSLQWNDPSPAQWRIDAVDMVAARRELLRIERRDEQFAVVEAVDGPAGPPLFERMGRDRLSNDAELACALARRTAAAVTSPSYYVPQRPGFGQEVIDICIPALRRGLPDGFVVATMPLAPLLETVASKDPSHRYELSFVETDGARLARAGASRGAGVYRAERLVDLPGSPLLLRLDSTQGSPRLIPNLATGLVMGLSLALFAVVLLLARDVRRRAEAERALAEALAFRKAMEDSLITGLRARDMQGRITYVNPAFCAMVGFSGDELLGQAQPPYWPPERLSEYAQRQSVRLGPGAGGLEGSDARQGFETVFMRKNGERFPVMIYEAPLVDGGGGQAGWMSAILDMSAQRQVEDLSRQQQERLQATARLATVGEMASLLSHELNQPLAAIASYAHGSLNLLDQVDDDTPGLLRQAVTRIAEQAERAGRVIKSVHDFVRRREQMHESLRVDLLLEAVLPLMRLQARKSGTRIHVDLPDPLPRVQCDRTMIEQVLLNLARNGIQAMESTTPQPARVLTVRIRQTHERWVAFSVIDAGPGIPPDVAERLFTPFFTTRTEGMGLGLSLCRTVIEQHGGALDFVTRHADESSPGGTEFTFTLPAERTASTRRAAAAAATAPAVAETPAATAAVAVAGSMASGSTADPPAGP